MYCSIHRVSFYKCSKGRQNQANSTIDLHMVTRNKNAYHSLELKRGGSCFVNCRIVKHKKRSSLHLQYKMRPCSLDILWLRYTYTINQVSPRALG